MRLKQLDCSKSFWNLRAEAGGNQEVPMKRGKQGCSRERGGNVIQKYLS